MALYTKIKGPVNYTVVGSPTIENGIASGFSASNYLELPSLNSQGLKKIEFGFCLNNVGDKNYRQYFSMTGLSLCISNGGGVGINYSGSSYYNWNTPPSTGEVLIKSILDIENSQLVISWTADGQTYKTSTHQLSVPISVNSVMYIGKNGTSLIESINLNNSYIKINDAAWFGSSFSKVKVKSGLARYTVVGNPTITNGIVSNFSNSNYLQIANKIYFGQNIEFFGEFTTGSDLSSEERCILYASLSNSKSIYFYYHNTRKCLVLYTGDGSYALGTTQLSANTSYYYRIVYSTSNAIVYIGTTKDNLTQEISSSAIITSNTVYISSINIGKHATLNHPWNGSMNINEWYIKINNDFCFRGSKQNILGYKIKTDNLFNGYYFIEDGKLKWANPNIRLIRTGGSNDYILTNYIPNTNTVVKITHGFDSAPEVMNERYTLLWNGGHYNSSTYPDAFYYSWWRASSNTNGYASWFYVGTSGGAQSYSLTMTAGHKYELIVSGSTSVNQKLTDLESGTVLQNYNNTWSFNGSLTNTLRIFSNNTNNTVKYYIYQTKIIENNTVLHQFVPVPKGLIIGDFIVPSNGMFDIIEQKFYPNQGTGKFEIGGIPEDYIIEDGKLIWCNDNIYLKCNGAQYFDSGFKANQDTKIEVDYTSNGSGTQALYCSRVNTGTATFTMFRPIGGGTRFDYNTSQNSISGTVSSGTRYIVIADKNECYIDGVLKFTATYSKFQSDMGMIFGCSGYGGGNLGNWSYHKYHKIQLYDNSKLIHYFLPVNTNTIIGNFTVPAPGMWDAVTQTFYPNKGTGTFTYGKDE